MRGNELPRLLTGGGGGVSLAWLLPISFTSGWAAAPALPLELLARHRGLGWESPSGWESHKCVNKRDEQSSLLCPGNSGLSWMAGGDYQALNYSRPPPSNRGIWEGRALEKAFSKKASCFAVMLQLFMFQVSNAMTN